MFIPCGKIFSLVPRSRLSVKIKVKYQVLVIQKRPWRGGHYCFTNTTCYTPAKQLFSGVYWNQPVCSPVCGSVCVQNTSFCQSAGGSIKSHLVTALVSICIFYRKGTKNGKECFTYDHKYWECKKDPGFLKMTLPKLW